MELREKTPSYGGSACAICNLTFNTVEVIKTHKHMFTSVHEIGCTDTRAHVRGRQQLAAASRSPSDTADASLCRRVAAETAGVVTTRLCHLEGSETSRRPTNTGITEPKRETVPDDSVSGFNKSNEGGNRRERRPG